MTRCCVREEVRASSHVVVGEEFLSLLLAKVFARVGPEDIAHQTVIWWFAESVNLSLLTLHKFHCDVETYALEIFQGM